MKKRWFWDELQIVTLSETESEKQYEVECENKRPTGLKGHPSIRYFTLGRIFAYQQPIFI